MKYLTTFKDSQKETSKKLEKKCFELGVELRGAEWTMDGADERLDITILFNHSDGNEYLTYFHYYRKNIKNILEDLKHCEERFNDSQIVTMEQRFYNVGRNIGIYGSK